jgi:hypothetical protein
VFLCIDTRAAGAQPDTCTKHLDMQRIAPPIDLEQTRQSHVSGWSNKR